MRPAPMTKATAEQNVAAMTAETPKAARRRVMEVALGPLGNLSVEAKAVYRRALADMG